MRNFIKVNQAVRRSERGAVLVVALLMLVILSIMGSFAMTISMIEQRVTLNSEIFQHNFYAAEGVTLEGAAAIHEEPDTNLLAGTLLWVRPKDVANPAIDMTLSTNWPSSDILPVSTALNTTPTNLTPAGYHVYEDATLPVSRRDRIKYSAIDNGVCAGASLTDPTREERCYDVYGLYDVKRNENRAYSGRMMMMVGYKKVLYY